MDKPKLLDQVRSVARLRHLSLRTEEAYSDWIRRFILFHGKRHPSLMGVGEIRQFLSHLAVARRVSASTQNQALCALLFLYRDVLQTELPYVEGIERAKRPARVPVVFTRQEVERLLSHLSGAYSLIASLLYGSGLRLLEGLRLRVKDIDFGYGQITVRAGKGEKDRRTILPRPLADPLRQQITRVKLLHEQDLREGYGAVYLLYALSPPDHRPSDSDGSKGREVHRTHLQLDLPQREKVAWTEPSSIPSSGILGKRFRFFTRPALVSDLAVA